MAFHDSGIMVCDAIMGTGKTQAVISYMNDHAQDKFIYITPYLDESERIQQSCPTLSFVCPSKELPDYHFSKLMHTRELLSRHHNITTTHACFRSYTPEMLDTIREDGYTLIIDEDLDVFQEAKCDQGDVQLLLDSGHIVERDGEYVATGKPYTGVKLKDIYEMFRCNNLIRVETRGGHFKLYFWTLPYELITSFRRIIILTYMFHGSDLRRFFELHHIEHRFIGVTTANGKYELADTMEYVPEYVTDIKSKVHILQNKNLNEIGDKRTALSANWMNTNKDGVMQLKNNLYNYLRNVINAKASDILWSTYKTNKNDLRGKGFTNEHTQFKLRATNKYRHKTTLAYLVNIFQTPDKRNYFLDHGIDFDEDECALSTMLQWIWRSAIRDGQEITIYIPSSRMRKLLEDWLDWCEKGGPAQ